MGDPTNEAGLSGRVSTDGDSLPKRASLPVVGIALTAPAVFDGYRVGMDSSAMPSKFVFHPSPLAGKD